MIRTFDQWINSPPKSLTFLTLGYLTSPKTAQVYRETPILLKIHLQTKVKGINQRPPATPLNFRIFSVEKSPIFSKRSWKLILFRVSSLKCEMILAITLYLLMRAVTTESKQSIRKTQSLCSHFAFSEKPITFRSSNKLSPNSKSTSGDMISSSYITMIFGNQKENSRFYSMRNSEGFSCTRLMN